MTKAPGRRIPCPGGYTAFLPDPLPPEIVWTPDLVRGLSDADRLIGRLAGEGGRLPNSHLLIRPFVRREAVLSSRIEGTQATLGELLAAEAGAAVERSPADLREVGNYVVALEHGISRFGKLPLSQVYEGLLLKMGEKGNDGGQFFTPREIIRVMVKVIDPRIGETIYDPGCGTGGFLAQAFEHMAGGNNANISSADQLETLKSHTFYGREKDNAIYPIALANLVLHNIDEPHIWHGNTLTGQEIYGGLFAGAPALYDVTLMNPPFGGKESKDAQTRFAYKTGATQVLFLQHVIDNLKPGGRCGIVLDEGVLFRTNETAFVQTKRKLLDDCDLWCILSLPPGTFVNAGAGVKANLLFFTRGRPTERIWYYDLSGIKVGKKSPLTLDKFEEFFRLLPERADSERSWTVTRKEIEAKNFDLKAVNPNAKSNQDTRTPEELLDLIEAKGREVAEALQALRAQPPQL
ncbi:MAG: N-6 DNA methylase [Candidatus Rokubacteria bacterium]|nr:N-6 DNA methylase [Candidatus Rokubacteria bacterium]